MVARKRKKKKKSNLEQGFVGVSRAIVNPQPPRLLSFIQLLLIDWTNQKRKKRKQKRNEMKGNKRPDPGRQIAWASREVHHRDHETSSPNTLATGSTFDPLFVWTLERRSEGKTGVTLHIQTCIGREKERSGAVIANQGSISHTDRSRSARTHALFFLQFFFLFLHLRGNRVDKAHRHWVKSQGKKQKWLSILFLEGFTYQAYLLVWEMLTKLIY